MGLLGASLLLGTHLVLEMGLGCWMPAIALHSATKQQGTPSMQSVMVYPSMPRYRPVAATMKTNTFLYQQPLREEAHNPTDADALQNTLGHLRTDFHVYDICHCHLTLIVSNSRIV
jgi:hypothetical protein